MTELKMITRTMLETAIEAAGWRWLQDKDGHYHIRARANAEHGELETEYWLSFNTDLGNAFLFRLYGSVWFQGTPEALCEAVDTWNVTTPYPKAALLIDEEGDSRLVLEWIVPCFDHAVPQGLVNEWLSDFSQACAFFLQRNADLLRVLPRYGDTIDPEQIN